jgi:DNA-binding transcriptional LysR family regulator
MGDVSVNFIEIEAFIQIVRHKSISKAAAALKMSQPAVSLRLKSLEQSIGGPLFVRTNRGMQLTSAGATLLPFAERIAELYSEGIANAETEVGRSRLVVATVESVACIVAANLLQSLWGQSPKLEVSVVSAYSYQVFQMVMEGAAHAGLVLGRESYPGLQRLEIISEPVRFYVRPDHPLLHLPECRLLDLAKHPVALSPWGTGWREQVDLMAEATRRQVRFWDVSPALVVKQLIEKGWVGLISRFHVAEEIADGRCVELNTTDLPSWEFIVSVILRERKIVNRGLRCFLACLPAYFPHCAKAISKTVLGDGLETPGSREIASI